MATHGLELFPDHGENVRRMREYNRSLALWLYSRLGEAGEPDPPLLAGRKEPYRLPIQISHSQEKRADQTVNPVGEGPDENGYYAVVGPDYHNIGELFMRPLLGGVFCKVETPVNTVDFEPKWVRII
jgi:hypothetical protein